MPGELLATAPVAARTGAAAADVLTAIARRVGAEAAAAQADALAIRLRRLAELDLEVLAAARSALARAGAGGDARRDFALGRALDASASVPLEIAEACADVAALGRVLAPLAPTETAPDAEAAARIAQGAAQAAAHLVEVNLALAPDDERRARARAAAEGP